MFSPLALVTISLVFLACFAVLDYRWRRIPNKLMMVPIVLGVIVFFSRILEGERGMFTVAASMNIVVLLWKMKAFGGADAKTLMWMFLMLDPVLVWASLFNCYLLLPAFFNAGGRKDAPMLVPLFAGLIVAIPLGNVLKLVIDHGIHRLLLS